MNLTTSLLQAMGTFGAAIAKSYQRRWGRPMPEPVSKHRSQRMAPGTAPRFFDPGLIGGRRAVRRSRRMRSKTVQRNPATVLTRAVVAGSGYERLSTGQIRRVG